MAKGTYYLGRVIKLGELDSDRIIQAIVDPKAIQRGRSAWTFIDAKHASDGPTEYVFARLIKYSPDAEVRIVDPKRRAEVLIDEPNLSVAASPFVYIPSHSGIAFLHVAQKIERHTFAARFAELVRNAHDNFFVECNVEFISDLRSFAVKLSRLERIYKLAATIYPPNPIFAPLWANLKQYIDERGIDTLHHEEEAKGQGASLVTDLPKHVSAIAHQTETSEYSVANPLPIGDAAILMAADGYGEGLVQGIENETSVTIRTSETVRNFSMHRNPDPKELFEKANELLEEIERQRHLRH